MSIALMSLIFEIKGQLTPTEKLLLLELSDHGNDQGNGIWPSLEKITARTSLSESTVRFTLQFLTSAGILETVEDPTAKKSTERRINVSTLKRLYELGEADQRDETIIDLRQTMRGEARKRGRVSATGTLENEPRVSTTGTQGADHRHSEYRPPAPRVPTTGTESLINHNLNIQEPKEVSTQKYSAPYLWNMISQQLREELSVTDYTTWVHPLKPGQLQPGRLTVNAINAYGCDWCNSRLGVKVSRLATALAGQEMKVVFQLEAQ